MKKNHTLMGLTLLALSVPMTMQAAPTGLDAYKLVWSDEFDGTELDSRIWNIEVNGNGGGNNELQYYAAGNVSVADGCLVLTAKRENMNGKAFTSGRINSMGKAAFMHGRIDARLKMPHTANGLWPAFWLMGNDMSTGTGWPYCGEIDVMEAGNANGIARGTQDRYMGGALHWGPYGAQTNWSHPMYATDLTASYSLQDDFHLFSLVWDDAKIEMYLDLDIDPDAKPYFAMNINDRSAENSPGNYFHKQFFILFDLAVGGDYTGIHDTNGITALADGPREMLVDYVRVYQREGREDYTTPDEIAVDPGPYTGPDLTTTIGDYASFSLNDDKAATFAPESGTDYIIIDADAQFRALVAENTLADYSPDANKAARIMVWNNTYATGLTSGINSMGNEEPWRHYSVNSKGWSTVSYRSSLSDSKGKDLSMLNEDYYFHFAMRGTDMEDHITHGVRVGKASFAIGNNNFNDEGTALQPLGDFVRDGRWVSFDIPFSKLLELNAEPFANAAAFKSDVVTFMSGGESGTDLQFDAVFFYRKADSSGINNVIFAPQANDDVARDLLGRPVSADYKGIVIKNGKKILVR